MIEIEKEKLGLGNKLEFVVGFFALVFALGSFKEELEAVKINILIGSFSGFQLIFAFLLILFFSIYLYAINYIRYDFPTLSSVRWLSWLRHIEFIASVVYFIAIIGFPLFVLITWGLSSIIKILSLKIFQSPIVELLIGLLTGFIGGVLSFFLEVKKSKEKKVNLVEGLEETKQQFFIAAKEAYNKGLYEFVLLNLYNGLIKLIESELVEEYDLETRRISKMNLISLAIKNNLVSEQELNYINELRLLRNQIAHGNLIKKISKAKANSFINRTNKIIKKRQENCKNLYRDYRKLKRKTTGKTSDIIANLKRRKEIAKELRKRCRVYLNFNPHEWEEIELE